MEFDNNRVEDSPFLFSSNKSIKKFSKNQEFFHLLNQETSKLQEEISELKKEVEIFLKHTQSGGGQFKLALINVNNNYPSKTPPDDQATDKVYQERYAIAQMFISGWKVCIDELQDCIKMCDELDKSFKDTILEIQSNTNQTLSQLEKLLKKQNYIYLCCDFLIKSKKTQIKNFLIEISTNLNNYQSNVIASKEKVKEYRETFNRIKLQINRIKMARTPAYSNQPQQCSICNEPYVCLKWCKFCDRKQFQEQFNNWKSGNSVIDNFIYYSQLSIKYPNGYMEWIPYDQFNNIKVIGRGGFATVYKANWIEGLGTWDYALGKRVRYTNTPVALKQLNNLVSIDQQDFFNEVRAYVDSSSSTVLRCYGISKNPKTKDCVMVLPFAHGGDLRKYLKKRAKTLSWVNRLDILRFILYGLNDIHKKGLVHHDFHPGNLLHYRRTISVAGLGLSHPVDNTKSNNIYGVLPFIAPEVLLEQPYTKAADIYSVGMIMWILTSGQYPFTGRPHDINLATDICKGVRPDIVKGTPLIYQNWMEKCWHENPDERPTSKELYDQVLDWLNGFDQNPSSTTIRQFIESKLEPMDKAYTFKMINGGSCDYSKISKAIVDHFNSESLNNSIQDESKTQINSSTSIEKSEKHFENNMESEDDQLDIIGDFSKWNVHSIVITFKEPQLVTDDSQVDDDENYTSSESSEEKESTSNEGNTSSKSSEEEESEANDSFGFYKCSK